MRQERVGNNRRDHANKNGPTTNIVSHRIQDLKIACNTQDTRFRCCVQISGSCAGNCLSGGGVGRVSAATVDRSSLKWPVSADQGLPSRRGIPAGCVAPSSNTPGGGWPSVRDRSPGNTREYRHDSPSLPLGRSDDRVRQTRRPALLRERAFRRTEDEVKRPAH